MAEKVFKGIPEDLLRKWRIEATELHGGRILAHHGLPSLYKHYKANVIASLKLPYKQYRDILDDINKGILELLLKGNEVKLPAGCGYLKVVKRKMSFKQANKLPVDWKRSKELGKRVYHLNENRDGYKYMYMWNKQQLRVPKAHLYSFLPCRKAKRTLAHLLLSDANVEFSE